MVMLGFCRNRSLYSAYGSFASGVNSGFYVGFKFISELFEVGFGR